MKTLRTLLIALLLCAACASHHHQLSHNPLRQADLLALQQAVSGTVPDAPRAARLTKSIVELQQQLLLFDLKGKQFRADLLTLNSRPDATRAEFDALIGDFDNQRGAIRTRMFELHAEPIAATTPEEWKELFPYERALLTDSEG